MTPKEKQIQQNEKLLKTENEMLKGIQDIRQEMSQMNQMLFAIFNEMKRGNDILERRYAMQQPATVRPADEPFQLVYN